MPPSLNGFEISVVSVLSATAIVDVSAVQPAELAILRETIFIESALSPGSYLNSASIACSILSPFLSSPTSPAGSSMFISALFSA